MTKHVWIKINLSKIFDESAHFLSLDGYMQHIEVLQKYIDFVNLNLCKIIYIPDNLIKSNHKARRQLKFPYLW